MKGSRSRFSAAAVGLVAIAAFGPVAVLADSSASELPPTWHVHDGQTSLGPQHKPVGFFTTILNQDPAVYALDPAECPDSTDKAFLPSSGNEQAALLRAGICQTSAYVIQLRTVPLGTSGPDGWASITVGTEQGWVTYYRITAR